MSQRNMLFERGLTGFSGLTSFCFIFFAVNVLTAEAAPYQQKLFAYVAAGYGIANIYLLSAAWGGGRPWQSWAGKLIALCFLGAYLLERWREGIESGIHYLGIFGLAGVLWLNWYALVALSRRRSGRPAAPTRRKGR